MVVVWLCNVPTKEIAQEMGISHVVSGGWLDGLSRATVGNNETELHYCFPSVEVSVRKSGIVFV